jgi:hypothetical protein
MRDIARNYDVSHSTISRLSLRNSRRDRTASGEVTALSVTVVTPESSRLRSSRISRAARDILDRPRLP